MNNQRPDPNEKFRGKYRTTSHRLKGYDYSSDGAYFVTICTKNREHFFGEIINDEMVLNYLGKIAKNEWEQTGKIRENIIIDEFVIMPNHVHGILWIKNDLNRRDVLPKRLIPENNENILPNNFIKLMQNGDVLPKRLYAGQHKKMSQISPAINSISTAIRFFKRQTTVESRKINPDFAWQPNYHDRIIRNENELNRIREYIMYNPQNWEKDDLYLENPAKNI